MTALAVPPPPDRVDHATQWFLVHAAEPLYVLLMVASFAVWGVLRWQRKPGESPAARAFRGFLFAKGIFWTVLAVTRWLAGSWLLTLYALVVVYILATTVWVLWSLGMTYVWPAVRGHPTTRAPIEDVLPPEPRPKERRRRSGVWWALLWWLSE